MSSSIDKIFEKKSLPPSRKMASLRDERWKSMKVLIICLDGTCIIPKWSFTFGKFLKNHDNIENLFIIDFRRYKDVSIHHIILINKYYLEDYKETTANDWCDFPSPQTDDTFPYEKYNIDETEKWYINLINFLNKMELYEFKNIIKTIIKRKKFDYTKFVYSLDIFGGPFDCRVNYVQPYHIVIYKPDDDYVSDSEDESDFI